MIRVSSLFTLITLIKNKHLNKHLTLDDHNITYDDDLLSGLYSELGHTYPSHRSYQQYPVPTLHINLVIVMYLTMDILGVHSKVLK